jgi:hypothetical protein
MNGQRITIVTQLSPRLSDLKWILLVLLALGFSSCQNAWHYLPQSFEEAHPPTAPDYQNQSAWASLPVLKDTADQVPDSTFSDNQNDAEVDCFYIHPTGFLDKDVDWNADVSDEKINSWTDEWPLRHQASCFNGSCKIYAPRYRQAHMKSFFHLGEGGAEALALAYQDVAKAFEFYLENYNNGRPFIIAGHSQGTTHAKILIDQFIDGTELQDRFVCAYLVGMPTSKSEFDDIRPCLTADDCGCFNCWTTYDHGYYPDFHNDDYAKSAVINPLNWSSSDELSSDYQSHQGILVPSFKLKYREALTATTHQGMLWVSKPNVPILKHFVLDNNWHKADYNLFWVNIRNNVDHRVKLFLTRTDQISNDD